MNHKSEIKSKASRNQYRNNSKLQAWSKATSISYNDYKLNKIKDIQYIKGQTLIDVMKNKHFQTYRSIIAHNIINGD